MEPEVPETAEEVALVSQLHSNSQGVLKCPHCGHGFTFMVSAHGFVYSEEIEALVEGESDD